MSKSVNGQNEEDERRDTTQDPPLMPTTEPVPVVCGRMSVEDIKDIEKFRLGVWIAKTSVVLMGIIITLTMSVFLYLSISTGTMPDAGVVFTLFNHLKELVVIVIDTGK